jgi:hypothetical protein
LQDSASELELKVMSNAALMIDSESKMIFRVANLLFLLFVYASSQQEPA